MKIGVNIWIVNNYKYFNLKRSILLDTILMAQLSDIKAAKFCGLLKKELCSFDRDSRGKILYNTMNWILQQASQDPLANQAYMWFQELYQVSQNNSTRDFSQCATWSTFGNHWASPAFRTAIASILDDNIKSEEEEEEDDEQEEEEEEEEEEDDGYDRNDTSITLSSRRGYGIPFGYDRQRRR